MERTTYVYTMRADGSPPLASEGQSFKRNFVFALTRAAMPLSS